VSEPSRGRVARPRTHAAATVRLWGHTVGALAENERREVAFEYTAEFRQTGLEISPIHLPLALRGPVNFPTLHRVESFAGLPGVFADALPDAFGNAIIRRFFAARGTPDAAFSPVQKLLYIGRRAMGALEFTPAYDGTTTRAVDDALHVATLVEEARRVLDGDLTVAVPEMMRVGVSAGGARAKAMILLNERTGHVKSAFASQAAGDEPWLIKFDGVSKAGGGHELEKDFAPRPYGRIEYAYSRLARAAGIDMAETRLLRERKFAHFMTKRFDRDGDDRLHLHSLGGMQHADYNVRQVLSYEDYFRTIRRLGMGQRDVDQAFRRMVFNFATRNQDDHVKNVAFLMGRDGRWRLAPAFDLTYARGGTWSGTHQMTAGGKDDGFTRADLMNVAGAFDVPHDGAEIIDAVDGSLGEWEHEAKDAGVEDAVIGDVRSAFRRFA